MSGPVDELMDAMKTLATALVALTMITPAVAETGSNLLLDNVGDHQIIHHDGQIIRLNKKTGATSFCKEVNGTLACRSGTEEREAWRKEIELLESRIEELEQRLAEVELQVDEAEIDRLSQMPPSTDEDVVKQDRSKDLAELSPDIDTKSLSELDADAKERALQDEKNEPSRFAGLLDQSTDILRRMVIAAKEIGNGITGDR